MASENATARGAAAGQASCDNVDISKGPRGMRVVTSFPRDNSELEVANPHGGELGGGITNLAHSLGGASAVTRAKRRS